MRAPFNNWVDLYFGPGTATPGVLKSASAECRLVPDVAFVDVVMPYQASLSYMTITVTEPSGPEWTEVTPGHWEVDFSKADRVALGGELQWMIQRVELRTWIDGTPYWRAYLGPIDPPTEDECPCPYYGCDELGIFVTRETSTHWEGAGATLEFDGTENWTLVTALPEGHMYTAGPWDGCGSFEFINAVPTDHPVIVECRHVAEGD